MVGSIAYRVESKRGIMIMTQEGYSLSRRGKRLGPNEFGNFRGISAEEIMNKSLSSRTPIKIINLDFLTRVYQQSWWRD
jgi:hypothetical protein